MNSLYRKEAIDYKSQRLFSDFVITQPPSYKILTFSVIILTLLGILLLFNGEYVERVTVHGFISPEKGLAKVYPRQAGTLQEIMVQEGQFIKKGDLIALVYTGKGMSYGNNFENVQLEKLNNKKNHIADQIIKEKNIFNIESDLLQKKILQISKEKKNLIEIKENKIKRIKLATKKIEDIEKLAKNNYVSDDYIKDMRDILLALEGELRESNQLIINNENKLIETSAELKEIPILLEKRLSELNVLLISIDQEIVDIEADNLYSIKSSISGKIANIQYQKGQIVLPSRPMLSIIPNSSKLQAELFIPSSAVGFISKNDSVKIRYDSFPYQKFGLHNGTVKSISENIYLPDELPVPVSINEPVYKVKVNIESQYINAYGKNHNLQNGMLLEADILHDKRSFIEWMLAPIYSLRGRI